MNAGSTIIIPFGKHIDVRGAICVASTSCGAPSDGSAGNVVKFSWTIPSASEYLERGPCYFSIDAACDSGMIIRNTIDEAKTGLNFVEFENALVMNTYMSQEEIQTPSMQHWSLMALEQTQTAYHLLISMHQTYFLQIWLTQQSLILHLCWV